MKEYKAVAKNIKSSVTKAQIPARIVKGMDIEEAIPVLRYMNKKAAGLVLKVVESAKANAVHNFDAKSDNLFISDIRVDKGLNIRRMRAGSRGSPIFFDRHMANITVVLRERLEDVEKVTKADKVVKAPKKAEKKAVAKVAKTK